MKFISLFKKEIKEMVTGQMIIGLVLTLIGFYFLGTLSDGIINDAIDDSQTINLVNHDESEFTASLLEQLEMQNIEINLVEATAGNYQVVLAENDLSSLLVIPEDFSLALEDGKTATLETYSVMLGTSMLSNISGTSTSAYATIFSEAIQTLKLAEELSLEEAALIMNPITIEETTIVGENSSRISLSAISNYVSSQTTFVPVIVFLLVMFSAQMIIGAISTEKIDKTLETLLSTPVSRASILTAKMLAAGSVAGIYAIVFMFSFNNFMGGMLGDLTTQAGVVDAIEHLGLNLLPTDYVLIGIQLFLSILIALSVSLILGALAKDVKSAQSAVAPMTVVLIIPYTLSMFTDINTLPLIGRILINIIPFTHTFTAFSNVMMGEMTMFWIGVAYQLIFLFVCMFFAVKVFMTDKIFTISLNLGQKNKFKKSKKSKLSLGNKTFK